MTVLLAIDPILAPAGVELATVERVLRECGLEIPREVLRRYVVPGTERLATRAPGTGVGGSPLTSVVIGRGTAPVAGKPARLEVVAPVAALEMGKRGPRVSAGEVVGQLAGGIEGRNGSDVYSRPIPCETPLSDWELGPGVVAESSQPTRDGVLRAKVAGRVVEYVRERAVKPEDRAHGSGRVRFLDVMPMVRLPGDLDPASGLTELGGDLAVGRNVMEGARLSVTGSVVVGQAGRSESGTVEQCRLEVGEDLLVAGGILGRERGEYSAGRDISCRFANGATLRAGRDVTTQGDLLHCDVTCGRKLTVGDRLHGCTILASEGISAKAIAGTNKARCVVETGIDPEFVGAASQVLPLIEPHLQRLEHAKLTIRPLILRRELLTPAQKQQAARLIQEVQRLEEELRVLTRELRRRWEYTREIARAVIHVEDLLGERVVVRIAGVEAVVPTPMRGPLRIRVNQAEAAPPEIVVVDALSNGSTTLPGRFYVDGVYASVRRVMARLL